MSLDMIDAIFIARRGVLRCSANSLGCAVCSCAATTAQRPTNTDAERPTTESVSPRPPPRTALSWAHCIPSTTPKTNPGSTGAQRTTVADAGRRPRRAVSPREGSAP